MDSNENNSDSKISKERLTSSNTAECITLESKDINDNKQKHADEDNINILNSDKNTKQNNQTQQSCSKSIVRESVSNWKSENLSKYDLSEVIGRGTFGIVYRAKMNPDLDFRNEESQNLYALKEIIMENETEGFPITALREIMLLKRLKHPNIIDFKEIVMNPQTYKVYLVFEYMAHDLSGIIDRNIKFPSNVVKYILWSLCKGLQYLHANNVLHRDIKSSNVLVSEQGQVKLADFGLAKVFNPKFLTNRVVTLWYRSPELLLGANMYDGSVDVWALG